MDKILIVIPVINLWDEYTIHCMESLFLSKATTPFEILIVDQCSTDQTVNKALDFGNRKMPGRVHVLQNKVNSGCAGGWNQGVEWGLAKGFTHFLIANNDVLVGPNSVQAMYDRMKKGGVMLVSAIDVAYELRVPSMITDPAHEVNNKVDSEAPHPHFSFYMIDKDTVEKVGWFDEAFFPAYFEDNDYHRRLKLAGGPNAAIANTRAVFFHFGSRTQNQHTGSPIVPGESFKRNEDYFIRKWGSVPGREKFDKPFNDQSKDYKYGEYAKRR